MTKESTISSIRKDGLGLQLMDGSRWEIAFEDITIFATWYKTARVEVDEDPDDESYPYRITNLDTSTPDVVRANLDSLPPECCCCAEAIAEQT